MVSNSVAMSDKEETMASQSKAILAVNILDRSLFTQYPPGTQRRISESALDELDLLLEILCTSIDNESKNYVCQVLMHQTMQDRFPKEIRERCKSTAEMIKRSKPWSDRPWQR